jgi:hypothetical protein
MDSHAPLTKTYQGLLALRSHGDADDVLFLSTLLEPFAQVLQDEISRKRVSVHYWVTDMEATKEQAQEDFAKTIMGAADCQFRSRYSETTGYLWTDEKCNVGGHDLVMELRSHVGRWLILEVDAHEEAEKTDAAEHARKPRTGQVKDRPAEEEK